MYSKIGPNGEEEENLDDDEDLGLNEDEPRAKCAKS
jgi:hypothetical protein